MRILVTGAAGFIGAAVSRRLLDRGDTVFGIDDLAKAGDGGLKERRLQRLAAEEGFSFAKADLAVPGVAGDLFAAFRPEAVVHLAARAGVRPSLTDPFPYVDANLVGLVQVLEASRREGVGHLVFASSSSVYGSDPAPFRVGACADRPVSFYAATKRAGELLLHSFAHAHGLPCTALRYFTVYGPWGRPDMAPLKWARAVVQDEPVELYAGGTGLRDLTFIDDVVEATVRSLDRPPESAAAAPWRVLNVCEGRQVEMLEFLALIEASAGREARRIVLPGQPGDVPVTWGDPGGLEHVLGPIQWTPLGVGVDRLVAWVQDFYPISS